MASGPSSMEGELIKVERGTPNLTEDAVSTLFTSTYEDALHKRKESKASEGNAAKDGPGNIGGMDQQPFQDRMERDEISNFSDFCRELKEKRKDDTWTAKLYENDSQSYYSFYQFNDLPDSKPSLSSAIRIFSDMKVEVFVNLNTPACLDPVPNNSLEWLFGNRSCPILSAWVQFDTLLSYFNTTSCVDGVKIQDELSVNSKTYNAADDDNDDSDELNNSTDKELLADRLALQASYKSDEVQYVGDADQSDWKQKFSSDRIVDVEQEERKQSSNIDESKPREQATASDDAINYSDSIPPCGNVIKQEAVQDDDVQVIDVAHADVKDPSEESSLLNIRIPFIRHNQTSPKKGCFQKPTTQGITEKHERGGGRDQFGCWFCQKIFTHSGVREIHMKTIHKDEYFGPTVSMEKDQSKSGQQKQFSFTCDRCKKSFRSKSGLTRHTNFSSKCQKYPAIKACLQKPTTQGITEKQERSGSRDQFGCRFCRKVFKHSSVRDIHMKTIHKDKYYGPTEKEQSESGQQRQKPFTCDRCKSTFISEKGLERHLNSIKCYLSMEKQGFVTNGPPKDLTEICEVCGLVCKDKRRLTQHTKVVHTKPHKCPICPMAYGNVGSLKTHIRAHRGEKPFKCKLCPASFVGRSSLVSHQRSHTGEKPFSCDICNKSFSKKSSVKLHKQTHHEVVGPQPRKPREKVPAAAKKYVCELCGQAFAHGNSLKIHQLKHAGKRPHSCDLCDKAFYSRYQLRLHKIVHTGVSPHKCSYCDRAFQGKYQLEIHIKRHIGEKCFTCEVCGRAFAVKGDLNVHRQLHTDLKPFACEICDKSFKTKRIFNMHKCRRKQLITETCQNSPPSTGAVVDKFADLNTLHLSEFGQCKLSTNL